jgi:hypothetical protein
MKPRRFKTRNGSIIEEWPRALTVTKNNFIDDYKIIKSTRKKYKEGDYICLFLLSNHAPIGGAHGEEWDIIEDVL